jgi:hypothetical protein
LLAEVASCVDVVLRQRKTVRVNQLHQIVAAIILMAAVAMVQRAQSAVEGA